MIITREKGMRMWGGGSGSTSASGVNGGGGFSLAVEEGEGTGNAYTDFTYESGTLTLNKATEFVTVDFFNRLFTAYDSDGNAILPNDVTSTINNLKLLVGTWTEEYLSALGKNSEGGGGGGGIELSDVWQSLKTNTDDYANQKINSAHIPDLSGTYATKTWVNQQGFVTSSGVTSVAMTVPTGLSVSGSPITSTGTLALTFATGYSIPTTAKQSNWDTAYGWGNHATAGYASASSVTTLQGYFTNGVANTAAKLNTGTTTYTAWGQTYWSSGVPQSISGNMTSVGNITPSANGNALGTTSARFNIYGTAGNFSGNVSVGGTLGVTGAATLSSTLSVAGGITLTTTKKIYFGDTSHYLELNSTGFHFSHGVYSDSFVSALGANSSGGGGGGIDLEAMWTELQGNTGTYANAKINVNHIPDISSTYGYAKTSQLGSYLPLSGGTMTGTVWRKMTTDTSNYEVSVGWVDTSRNAIAEIGYLNTSQKIIINPTKATSPWIDAVGKYILSVGSNSLTYNTYNILHANNYSDYALPLTGGTLYKSTTDVPLYVKTFNAAGAYIGYQKNDGTTMGFIGVHPTYGAAYVSSGSTYPILRSDNYSSYALPLSGGTLTGNLISTKSGTSETYFRATNSNGSIELLTSTNRGVYDRTTTTWLIGTDGTNTWLSQGNVGIGTTSPAYKLDVVGSIRASDGVYVGTGGAAGNSYVTSDEADNIYLRNSSGAVLVCDGKVVRRGTTLSDVTLGSSSYPWLAAYATTFYGALSGNATTATTASKLSTISKTAWGQTYWTSGGVPTSISGNLSDVGNITADYYTLNNTAANPYLKLTHTYNSTNYNYYIQAYTGLLYLGAGSANSMAISSTGQVFLAGHLFLDGAQAASSTGNTTQIIFRASNTQQVAISSNSSALIINPTSSTTTKQIVLGVGSVASTFGNSITCSGEVTASSDGRKKNIISNTKFNVKDIASARSVLFEWNDGRDDDMEKKIHGGSIAQDWLGKADSFLSQDNDGFYSINYGALALCSAITIAREVVKHEDRITLLEKENARLKARVAELEERRA